MGVAYGINECIKCKRTSHTTDGLCRYCGADNSSILGVPFIYMCDNCGQEDPPLMSPNSKSSITKCCGAGFTGNWKDGWGKRLKIVGQPRINSWRESKQRMIDDGNLPICEWSLKGHYEI